MGVEIDPPKFRQGKTQPRTVSGAGRGRQCVTAGGWGWAEEPEEEVGAPRPAWVMVLCGVGSCHSWGAAQAVGAGFLGANWWYWVLVLPWVVLQSPHLHPCGVSPSGKALCFSLWDVSLQGAPSQPCLV